MLRELQSQGVESHLILRGRNQNALSVGVFSQRRRAEAQQQRVAKLGYEVLLQTLARYRTEHYAVTRIEEHAQVDGVPLRACADIASMQ